MILARKTQKMFVDDIDIIMSQPMPFNFSF